MGERSNLYDLFGRSKQKKHGNGAINWSDDPHKVWDEKNRKWVYIGELPKKVTPPNSKTALYNRNVIVAPKPVYALNVTKAKKLVPTYKSVIKR